MMIATFLFLMNQSIAVPPIWEDPDFVAPPFPDRPDYLMERDPKVTDEALLSGKIEIEPFPCGTDFYKTSCLDYSTLIRMPLEKLKPLVMNIGDYATHFQSAGVTKSVIEPHPQPQPGVILAYIKFYLGLGIDVPYYMDAELYPQLTPLESFGYRYRQNEEKQKKLHLSVTPRQSGAWYFEKFGKDPDVYYARLRGAVEVIIDLPVKRYYAFVKKRTEQIFQVLGEIPPNERPVPLKNVELVPSPTTRPADRTKKE